MRLRRHAFELINESRAEYGLKQLTYNESDSAQRYADELLRTHDFKHSDFHGENIAYLRYYQAYWNERQAITHMHSRMMDEPDVGEYNHKDNILGMFFKSVAVGVAFDGEYIYFVQHFYF